MGGRARGAVPRLATAGSTRTRRRANSCLISILCPGRFLMRDVPFGRMAIVMLMFFLYFLNINYFLVLKVGEVLGLNIRICMNIKTTDLG